MNENTKTFIGVKMVKATPMNRADYNAYRQWTLPANEDGADEGYLVEYTDGGKPNVVGHAGYVSWSPKEQFDNAHNPIPDSVTGVGVDLFFADIKAAVNSVLED